MKRALRLSQRTVQGQRNGSGSGRDNNLPANFFLFFFFVEEKEKGSKEDEETLQQETLRLMSLFCFSKDSIRLNMSF